ncbi:MAG: UDP-N-acetylmuramoyl-L-alanine--D-glutamate ligase [Candidatus Levybacteria bacterium]|nr:UDP-N-acetylmuramoyl-L-alanine--D-glutamate ligase [Candidatus Levybacteria bacterium]
MISFKGKKIAVIGAGIEGLASEKFFKSHGAEVTVLDQKHGKEYLDNLEKFDLVIRSPGVKLDLLNHLAKNKITSQTKLFFDLCPCPIIGVTGTKGKGTTASLIYEMLKKQGFDAYLGGNIGQAPLDFLEKLKKDSIAVLELSSFQLQDLTKSPSFAKASAGKPHIAVVLMVTSEHLDYHKDTYEYVDAKRNILRFQAQSDYAILNKDYPASNESDIHTEGQVLKVSRETEVEEGCFVKDGKIWIRIGAEVARGPVPKFLPASARLDDAKPQRLRTVGIPSFRATPRSIEITSTKEILLPGEHNWENVCAAVMAAWLSGVSKANIVKVLKNFKGLQHRLELVRELNGVKYYDDSFSTTPETAIAAIQAFKNPEILILGGSGKGSDFTELGQVISNAKSIKAIIGIGEEWKRIKSQITNPKSQINSKIQIIEGCKNMKEIVREASQIAKPGDIVLLSPACASFGMFKNYKDRGEQFKKEVEKFL